MRVGRGDIVAFLLSALMCVACSGAQEIDTITQAQHGHRLSIRSGDRIAMVGDSLTSPRWQYWWPLARDVDAQLSPPPTWFNLGISGAYITHQLAPAQLDAIAAVRPTVMIFEQGINDAYQHHDPAQFESDYRRFLDEVEARAPGIRIMLVGPWVYGGERPDGVNPFDAEVDVIRDRVRAIARSRHLPFVDVRRDYFRSDVTGLLYDCCHPTWIEGTAWLSARVMKHVRVECRRKDRADE